MASSFQDYRVNKTFDVATQGVLSNTFGRSTLGWIIREEERPPVVVIPPVPVPGFGYVNEPNRDWWYRKDENDAWVGPLSYRDANFQARRMTVDVDETIHEVKYAQLGTRVGTRGGDPPVDREMVVVYMYSNGRQYLGGRLAEYNKDKVPPE